MPDVTQWMVNQLVKPEVQKQVEEEFNGIDMNQVRLAWPFKTEEERKQIHKFLNKKKRQIKIKLLNEVGEAKL